MTSPQASRGDRVAMAAERWLRNMTPGRRLRFLLAEQCLAAGVPPRPAVLDAGCEDGLLAVALARAHPDWRVVGCDLNLDAIVGASRLAADAGARNASFFCADLARPVAVDAFDVVLAMECLAEIPDDDAVLRTLAGALRPGGRLVVHVPEATWEPVLRGSRRQWSREVRHGYTRESIRAKVEAAGLEVVEIRGTTRALAHLAQEVRDRWVRNRSLKVRLAAFGPLVAAVRLERMGVTWGTPRALLVDARRR